MTDQLAVVVRALTCMGMGVSIVAAATCLIRKNKPRFFWFLACGLILAVVTFAPQVLLDPSQRAGMGILRH